ncbi:MAG: aminotransferase class I/II-fold pyridoxal phosphate-dependent enzyme [Polyangiaceae bacterium]
MDLRPFELERYFAKWEFAVEHVLCASDCETRSVRELSTMEPSLTERLADLRLGYVDSRGSPSLRAAIARLYSKIDADDVLVFTGAQEAILWVYSALVSAGDRVVVETPCYASHWEVPRARGANVVAWRTDLERASFEDVALDERTRLVAVNLPHNPTGVLLSQDAWRGLVGEVASSGAVLFSDEVFRGLEHDRAARLPAACDLDERAISLGVMSKSYGLAGLRVGWIATRNKAAYERVAALKDYSTICGSAPSELLAEVALAHGDRILEENVARILSNLELCDAFFARHEDLFEWRRPRAGCVAFVGLRRGEVGAFCSELVEATGVLLLPGQVFGADQNHFRIGFGRSTFAEGLARLDEFVNRWSNRQR